MLPDAPFDIQFKTCTHGFHALSNIVAEDKTGILVSYNFWG